MEFIKLRKFSSKPKNSNKVKSNLWQDFLIFGSHENRHLHDIKKTARCGASPHQLLWPPDPFSLSTRSSMTAYIINTLKWYKLSHFIQPNGEPKSNWKNATINLDITTPKKILCNTSVIFINVLPFCWTS